MMIRKISALLALVAAVSGCAHQAYWTMTDDVNKIAKSKSFEITVPEGWNRTTTAETKERLKIGNGFRVVPMEQMTASRDGPGLQAIDVTRHYLDTAFPNIKKKSTASMLPVEAADLYVSDLRKRTGLERLKVLSNKPARVNGEPAFQLVMEFKNDDGLRIRIVSHGFVDKTGFYTIDYWAPALYYYERDYGAYANLVRSFRELKGAFDPPPSTPGWAKEFT